MVAARVGTSRRRGRRLAAVAACLLLATAVAVTFRWRDLAVDFHVRQLGRQPARLREALAAPRDSVRFEALQVFVRTPAGAARTLELFLVELEDWSLGMWPSRERLRSVQRGLFGLGQRTATSHSRLHFCHVLQSPTNHTRHTQSRSLPPEILLLWEVLSATAGEALRAAQHPGHRFTLLSVEEAEEKSGLRWPLAAGREPRVFLMEWTEEHVEEAARRLDPR